MSFTHTQKNTERGTIVATYLDIKTEADLLLLTDMADGDKAKTSGKITATDGLGADFVYNTVDGWVKQVNNGHYKVADLAEMRTVTTSPATIISLDGRWGNNYFKKVSSGTENGGTILVLDNGDIYELNYEGIIHAKWFGTVGDGVADDTLSIQNAIDLSLRDNISKEVYLHAGTFKTNDTLHLGYSEYQGVTLTGNGSRYKGENPSGTTIIPTFVDRPVIAVTAARITRISKLSLKGLNADFVYANKLGLSTATFDDRLIDSWKDPALTTMTDGRYNPYCGIAIDPYSGPIPANPSDGYPDVNFPTWTGLSAQYGKDGSSQVVITDVVISGFVAGVALQPSNYDGNGDFISFSNCALVANLYGFSVGNSQTRQIGFSDSLLNNCHTAYTSVVHGNQKGKNNTLFANTNFDACIKWLLIDSTYGAIHLDTCYGENAYIILEDIGGSSNKNPVNFTSCEFSFHGSLVGFKGKPKHELSTANGNVQLNSCIASFEAGTPDSNASVLLLTFDASTGVTINNSKFPRNQTVNNAAQAIALNMSQNAICPSERYLTDEANYHVCYNVDNPGTTLSTYIQSLKPMPNLPTRNETYPKMVGIANRKLSSAYSNVEIHNYIATTAWSNITVNGLITSVDIGTSEINRAKYRLDLGDIISYQDWYHFVSGRVGSVLELTALNDYEVDGTQNNPLPSSPTGDAVFWHSRTINTNSGYEYFFTFTEGSNVANVRRAQDNYLGNLTSDFTVGDRLLLTKEMLGVFRIGDNQKIVSVDDVAGTITFEGNARRTVTDTLVLLLSRTFNS